MSTVATLEIHTSHSLLDLTRPEPRVQWFQLGVVHVFVDVRHRVQHGAVPVVAVGVVRIGGRGAGLWGRVVALVVPRLILDTTEHVLHSLK